jgi:hypothetical protein
MMTDAMVVAATEVVQVAVPVAMVTAAMLMVRPRLWTNRQGYCKAAHMLCGLTDTS